MKKSIPVTPSPDSAYTNGNGVVPAGLLDKLFFSFRENEDFRAFEKIFKKLYQPLFQSSLKLVASHETAEEIVDDVFVNLWRNRKKIEIQISFGAYLKTAVRNRSLDYLRNVKRTHNCSLDYATHVACQQADAQEVIAYHELRLRMEEAIEKLPHQCRTIFLLNRDQSLKYKEIAQRLNISIKTVDTQMTRARKYLRQAVDIN